jgi:hypothetical protein
VNHAEERPRLASMRSGHAPDEKWIECVRAVQIDHRLSGQRMLANGVQSQSKHKRMPIEQNQPILCGKTDLRVPQAEEPILVRLPSSARRAMNLRN